MVYFKPQIRVITFWNAEEAGRLKPRTCAIKTPQYLDLAAQ
jgi:hypothetical protein